METVLLIVGVLFIAVSAVLCYMAYFAVRPKVHTLEYELAYLEKIDYMKTEEIGFTKEYYVSTFDGHKLWVGFLPAERESKHFVILSHGYTSTRYGMYKYAVLWRRFVLYMERVTHLLPIGIVKRCMKQIKDTRNCICLKLWIMLSV